MSKQLLGYLESQIKELHETGLYKHERFIDGQQQAEIKLHSGEEVINLCANNYLGLANHPELIKAAHQALDSYGYGMASVRFICGTHQLHKDLEARLSQFLTTDDTILFSSCFDANTGLFETILGAEDAIISDSLNHASIIDGVRLCKAQRFRYANNDMADLEAKLKAAQNARFRLIVTDGVFSMDGIIANLKGITDLAEKYDALVCVDDSHAVGFLGDHGRGSPEYCGVLDKIDILTGTLGKALGGASGGYVSGRKQIVEWLRNRSRPYLFSNALAPMITATSMKVLDMLDGNDSLRQQLHANSEYFRAGLQGLGFDLVPGEHPIIPVMLGDAVLANQMSDQLLKLGIYVIGFSFPVVPKGQARIRTQMSAGLTQAHLDKALTAFETVGKNLKVI